jgi:long-chain fatty acid transport protein
MTPRLLALGTALVIASAAAAPADAGGLSRPNVISARGVGMAGAWSAIADDPTALHYNPGALGFLTVDSLLLGVELVYAPRSYTPILLDGTEGPPEESSVFAPVPALGVAWRLTSDGEPTGVVLGVGVWNTFGGQLSYEKFDNPSTPAVNSTEDLVLEVVPGIGYQVNDVLSIGASLRVGIGLFAVDATAKPLDTDISSFGVGIGASLGVLVRPTDKISIGAVWRSNLDIATKGSGTVETSSVEVAHTQQWPQQLGLSVAVQPTRKLRLAVQYDWTQWSRFDSLIIEFPDEPSLNQTFDLDWDDNFAIRGGFEYAFTDRVAVRAGALFDSAAVPDRTIERQYLDADKISGTAGASFFVARKWRLDTALEVLPGVPRTVEDNRAEASAGGWGARGNIAPGDHVGSVFTLELGAQYLF